MAFLTEVDSPYWASPWEMSRQALRTPERVLTPLMGLTTLPNTLYLGPVQK